MFQRNHLCSHNVGSTTHVNQRVSFNCGTIAHQRPERDTSITTLDTPRQTSRGDGNRFKVPNWNIGVSGSRARPCMCARPSSLYGEKSFLMSAPAKRSPQCMRKPDGEAAYTTLRVSSNRVADKMLSRHLATSLQGEAPATPSAPRCGRAILHTNARDKRRMDLRPGANPEKTADPHQLIYLNDLVC